MRAGVVGDRMIPSSLEQSLRVKRISARPHDLLDIDGLLALGKNRCAKAPEAGELSVLPWPRPPLS